MKVKGYDIKPGADLSGADLSWADLRGADLSGAHLSRANLSGAHLYKADLYRADLHGADLRGAYLSEAYLSGAHLSRANLSGANLYKADLYRADLHGADLSWVNLSEAGLSGADLSGANLSDTCLDPSNEPNGQCEGFEREGEYCVGYRSHKSAFVGCNTYYPGGTYHALVFSTSDTKCHPGLYVCPTIEAARTYSSDIVKVRFKPEDCHKAEDKWRVRTFDVIEFVGRR